MWLRFRICCLCTPVSSANRTFPLLEQRKRSALSSRLEWRGTPSAGALTVKTDATNVLEEHPPFHRVHLLTDAHGAGTEVHVHAVQGVGHGVHGIDYKLHLALLFVLGVAADSLVT